MENFIIGGEIFEKYIGKIMFGEVQTIISRLTKQQNPAARELKDY